MPLTRVHVIRIADPMAWCEMPAAQEGGGAVPGEVGARSNQTASPPAPASQPTSASQPAHQRQPASQPTSASQPASQPTSASQPASPAQPRRQSTRASSQPARSMIQQAKPHPEMRLRPTPRSRAAPRGPGSRGLRSLPRRAPECRAPPLLRASNRRRAQLRHSLSSSKRSRLPCPPPG